MNEIFMIDRMMKKRSNGPAAHNTQEQPAKTFEMSS
jgi:hypothetical protein